jgi:WD40 repeat protein
VLTGSDDQTVRLWDVNDDTRRDGFTGHGGPVTGVAFAADGRRAYSCGKDNTLRVWDVEQGQELRHTMDRLGTFVNVAFMPDGRQVLSAEGDKLRLDDVDGKRDPRMFPACGARVTSVAVSRDGKKALAGDVVGGLHLWDVESGKELGRWEGHKGAVTSVALSPDGSRALSGGGDQTMRVWQVRE